MPHDKWLEGGRDSSLLFDAYSGNSSTPPHFVDVCEW
jgi:hypothetical protein